jgi:hypothetical protein
MVDRALKFVGVRPCLRNIDNQRVAERTVFHFVGNNIVRVFGAIRFDKHFQKNTVIVANGNMKQQLHLFSFSVADNSEQSIPCDHSSKGGSALPNHTFSVMTFVAMNAHCFMVVRRKMLPFDRLAAYFLALSNNSFRHCFPSNDKFNDFALTGNCVARDAVEAAPNDATGAIEHFVTGFVKVCGCYFREAVPNVQRLCFAANLVGVLRVLDAEYSNRSAIASVTNLLAGCFVFERDRQLKVFPAAAIANRNIIARTKYLEHLFHSNCVSNNVSNIASHKGQQ